MPDGKSCPSVVLIIHTFSIAIDKWKLHPDY